MGSATTRESEVAVQREFTQEVDGGGFMWREPRNSIRLAFDPGGEVELRGGEINSHTPVLKEYLDIYMAQDPQVSEIIRELLDQPPTHVVLSGHDYSHWMPTTPLPVTGAYEPIPPAAAKHNYTCWLSATNNTCPLLYEEATTDILPPESQQLPLKSLPEGSLRPERDALISKQAAAISTLISRTPAYWKHANPSRYEELTTIFGEAFHLASKEFGVEEATAIGNGYRVPTSYMTRDLHHLVSCGGNLRTMASEVFRTHSPHRLSLPRIVASLDRVGLHGASPRSRLTEETSLDLIRLTRLAECGIPIPRYPTFQANQTPPRHNPTYRAVHEALNSTLVQLWESCLVFFIPTSCLVALRTCHFTPISWTVKTGKLAGRYLFDARSKSAGTPLNCYDANHLEDLRKEWGTLTLPTIHTLVNQILKFEDDQRTQLGPLFDPRTVTLLKGDLSKAFTLLSFSADSVELTASELYQPTWDPLTPEQARLMDDLLRSLRDQFGIQETTPPAHSSWSMVYHTGSFGLRILPFMFGVVSRFLLFLLAVALWGYAAAYVDDFLIVTLSSYLAHDQAVLCEVISLLLGPNAVEWAKFHAGRKNEWVGWEIDLDTRLVSLGRRNLLKVLYGFFSFDVNTHIQGRHLLKLASWASRYTTVMQMLTPFTNLLYAQTNGLRNLDSYVRLTVPTQIAIWIWRATLLELILKPASFCRPLDSFRTEDPHYLIEYDSSLEGTGLLIEPLPSSVLVNPLTSTLCGQSRFPFSCSGDSSYQNTAELIPVALGCLELARRGIKHARIALRGDSRTSLAWSLAGNFTGGLCCRTSIVLTQLAVHFDLSIVSTEHIPGDENHTCDALSRFYTSPEILGYTIEHTIPSSDTSLTAELLKLCDPTLSSPFSSHDTFSVFWGEVREFILRIDPPPLSPDR